LAALLKLPHPEGYPPITLSSQKQKEKTQEALVVWLCSEAIQQAMIYAWEDLHWADPSTLELLTLFLNHVPTTRLFVVLTFRPEFTPPWGAYSYLSQLTLSRLGRSHVEVMVEKITSGKALPKEIVQQIVSKTDGIPLFVEELTKTVLESVESIESIRSEGKLTRSSLQLGIPATLQDALMARLDRLGPAKEIAKFGATIGREFDYVLLRAVSSLNEEALQQGLKQLVEAELVYQSGVPPQARYLFKHALVQDIAYQSLLKSRRHQLHEQVAQVLAEQFPETVESQPELVAHHYTEAGLVEQAIPYWQQAGERANQSSAYTEAVGHLTKELALLKTLADTPEHIKQELTLQLTLGDALAAVKGYAAPEVGKAATRARELCQQLGETPQLPSMLYRLSLFYMIRGEVQTAHELAKQMLRLAQSLQEQHLLAHAHTRLGWTLYDLGELTSARPHLAEAIALCDPQQHPRCSVKAYYPRVECLSYTAGTLWHLGYPDQALQRSREAVAVAEGLSRPHLLAYALGAAALFHSFRREELLARERAEEAITVSTEHGFPFWLGYGTTVRGWALAEQGQVEEGITQMQQGLAAFRALRSGVHLPYFLARLAEAYRQGEQAEEGLTVLDEALAVVGQTGERVNEAELYRLKGELTQQKLQVASSEVLTPESQAEVESCFLKAVEIARHQQAKSLELRAAMSLVKLWRQQGKQKQAHEMLAEIYGWFTEGFDTKDLQDARALLDELS
jgi:predicted ATPase